MPDYAAMRGDFARSGFNFRCDSFVEMDIVGDDGQRGGNCDGSVVDLAVDIDQARGVSYFCLDAPFPADRAMTMFVFMRVFVSMFVSMFVRVFMRVLVFMLMSVLMLVFMLMSVLMFVLMLMLMFVLMLVLVFMFCHMCHCPLSHFQTPTMLCQTSLGTSLSAEMRTMGTSALKP